MTSFILVFFGVFIIKTRTCQLHVFEGIKINKKFPPCCIFVRTQFSEINIRKFQSEKTQPFNLKVTAALQQLTEISTEWKIAFFLHFHQQEKGGMRFYFENTPWPVKEGCIRWRVFWICPKPDLGNLSSVTLYISWDNIGVYPKTTSSSPTNCHKCL